MMMVRRNQERGLTKLSWLESRHAFSFGRYYDANHLGFGHLRVLNDDIVAPGSGFSTHHHDNMEIISYVISGALAHKDSLGHGAIIQAGDVQLMSAGTGIEHSEFNASQSEPVHFLQLWIKPQQLNIAPRYQQQSTKNSPSNTWHMVVSPDGGDDCLSINQKTRIYMGRFADGQVIKLPNDHMRHGWLHIIAGQVKISQHQLNAGDAIGLQGDVAQTIDIQSPVQALYVCME